MMAESIFNLNPNKKEPICLSNVETNPEYFKIKYSDQIICQSLVYVSFCFKKFVTSFSFHLTCFVISVY